MIEMLRFDPSASFPPNTGIESFDVSSMGPVLEILRDEVCEIDAKMLAGEIATPTSKMPLDAGFYALPERLLAEYQAARVDSELGRVLSVTKQLMSEVDRIVVLGAGGSHLGARALLDACCQPYFNELSRGERGSRPRIYIAGNDADNDATQGLLHLLGAHRGRAASGIDESWGLVVVCQPDDSLQTAAALRQYLAALQVNCGGDRDKVRSRLIAVTGNGSDFQKVMSDLGCDAVFSVPKGVGQRFSVLSAVGLVPAALMGINVMKLLEGASAINQHFRTAKAADNMVLQFAAVNHLLEVNRGATVRILNVWSQALESAGKWYEQLCAASLGKALKGATPLTTVNPRDLPARHQQHLAGRRDKIIHDVIVENCRFDPLAIENGEDDMKHRKDISSQTLPDIMSASIATAHQSLADAGRPSTQLYMPRADECSMGQLFQMLMLATVVEGRLLGINPHGQPDLDAYNIMLHLKLSGQASVPAW